MRKFHGANTLDEVGSELTFDQKCRNWVAGSLCNRHHPEATKVKSNCTICFAGDRMNCNLLPSVKLEFYNSNLALAIQMVALIRMINVLLSSLWDFNL